MTPGLGLGVRSIERNENGGGYLIVAGPHDEGGLSRLFRWSGSPDSSPQVVAHVDFTGLNPESLFFAGERVMVLSDDGGRNEPGEAQDCKDLPPKQQKFRGVEIHP